MFIYNHVRCIEVCGSGPRSLTLYLTYSRYTPYARVASIPLIPPTCIQHLEHFLLITYIILVLYVADAIDEEYKWALNWETSSNHAAPAFSPKNHSRSILPQGVSRLWQNSVVLCSERTQRVATLIAQSSQNTCTSHCVVYNFLLRVDTVSA